MLLFDVAQEFDKQIRELFTHRENVINFLLHHERKQVVLANVCHQVLTYEHRAGPRANKRQRNLIISVAAEAFSHAALKHKHEQLMNDIEKQQVMHSEQDKHDTSIMHETNDEVKEI